VERFGIVKTAAEYHLPEKLLQRLYEIKYPIKAKIEYKGKFKRVTPKIK
jgi:hypothetical protein